ncbi:tyrosine-type recombinase/integrase [Gracilibacillus salitolerans]|uniref:Tyrosine-type recombinase/integrase n=1 Tax=Gracilibacillus salitolerans TaxID=2663022 RepID=A0A5Q2THJ6_9BACI|nr:tyrosine-type recombinase/integrase [Gracilibacillus salitolerans]QGH34206.1 tyrosine-type recombinase/integrase [Gracilibacillus salitolerans]
MEYKEAHGFRHTHDVLQLESGVNLKYVAHHLGHQTIKTTSDKYLSDTAKWKMIS